MKKLRSLVLVIGLLTLCAGATAQNRPEPNAFLNKAAYTHDALMRQIRTDDEVMDRFRRHFGMTREQVIDYFSTLSLSKTERDQIFLVYNSPESGVLRVRALRYRKGTPIWVDQQGTPILKVSCGNPLVPGSSDGDAVDLEETIADTEMKSMRDLIADIEAEGAPEELFVSELAEPGVPEIVAEVVIPSTPTQPVTVPDPMNPIGPITTGGDALAFGNLLSILTGAVAVGSFGENPNPIPEPGSMAGLGIGIAAIGGMRMRRRRKPKLNR